MADAPSRREMMRLYQRAKSAEEEIRSHVFAYLGRANDEAPGLLKCASLIRKQANTLLRFADAFDAKEGQDG